MSLWNILDDEVSKPKYLARGQVVAFNITNGGSAYSPAPLVTIAAPLSGITATATAVLTAGVVTSIVITNPGSGYTIANPPTVTFDSGAAAATAVFKGSGLTPYDNSTIFFVDREEASQAENKAKGFHGGGWYKYTTYTDANSVVRHKAEMLVALDVLAATSGDASDDTVLLDRTITIVTAPVAASVTAPAASSFTVVASVSPNTTITYKWQKSTVSGGSTYADLANAGVYSGVTADTLAISDSTGLDGFKYRVVVSSSGATNKTTTGVVLTVAP